MEVAVAGRLIFRFRLRPLSDVWEANQYRSVLLPDNETLVTFFGPDVDTSRTGSFAATKGRKPILKRRSPRLSTSVSCRTFPSAAATSTPCWRPSPA